MGECRHCTASRFDAAVPFGSIVEAMSLPSGRCRSENLAGQAFADESFDLAIMQGVFEHVPRLDLTIREVVGTPKPGSTTLMTVPLARQGQPLRRHASLEGSVVTNSLRPEYNGDPVGTDGSLVMIDRGFGIAAYLQKRSGLCFMMLVIDDIDLGIRAELNVVLVGFKVLPSDLSPWIPRELRCLYVWKAFAARPSWRGGIRHQDRRVESPPLPAWRGGAAVRRAQAAGRTGTGKAVEQGRSPCPEGASRPGYATWGNCMPKISRIG